MTPLSVLHVPTMQVISQSWGVNNQGDQGPFPTLTKLPSLLGFTSSIYTSSKIKLLILLLCLASLILYLHSFLSVNHNETLYDKELSLVGLSVFGADLYK